MPLNPIISVCKGENRGPAVSCGRGSDEIKGSEPPDDTARNNSSSSDVAAAALNY